MPHWQAKDPDQRHVISRRPLQDSVLNHPSLSQMPNRCQDKSEVVRGGGGRRRRSGKEVKCETKQGTRLELINFEPPPSSKGLVLHRRPGYGQLGTKCLVKANHFLAEISERDLSHYSVSSCLRLFFSVCCTLMLIAMYPQSVDSTPVWCGPYLKWIWYKFSIFLGSNYNFQKFWGQIDNLFKIRGWGGVKMQFIPTLLMCADTW